MQDLTGQTLGQYRIVEPLGRGGMASVFKAFQPSLERYVAVKVLPPEPFSPVSTNSDTARISPMRSMPRWRKKLSSSAASRALMNGSGISSNGRGLRFCSPNWPINSPRIAESCLNTWRMTI